MKSLHRMYIATLLTIPPLIAPSARAAMDCGKETCIDVYVENGQVVIEGKKGSGPPSTKVISPPKKSSTPIATKKPTPKPTTTGISTKKVVKKTVKPVVKRPAKKTTTSQSLQDKLVEAIPTGGIAYSPSFEPLVGTPVFLWSDLPSVITKKITIVGEVVTVELRPFFLWHYGDGVIYYTRDVGAPFPDGKIQHSYKNPGHYLIELITNWSGTFEIAGIKKTIPGEITTVSVLPITIIEAPTRFMN